MKNPVTYPKFNYQPLDELFTYLNEHGSPQAKRLMDNCLGQEDCCFGNPCYYLACLACFCRGNIRYLTVEQAATRDGRRFAKEHIEYGGRVSTLHRNWRKPD